MASLRILNAFYAALFFIMTGVSLAFLSAARDGYGRGGPETAAAWTALFGLFGILAFLNMRRAAEPERAGSGLLTLNVAAALPMIVGLIGLAGASRFLCCAAALPFALTAAWLIARRRR